MSPAPGLMIIEQCRISPLAGLTPRSSLPLTFFDLVFLRFPPVQRLFVYEYPFPKSQFLNSELPNLKQSLSLALHHFFPLAGTLTHEEKPEIYCSEGDSVSLLVTVNEDDFNELSMNHAQEVSKFKSLVPPLFSSEGKNAVFAIQVTIFPNAGIVIGTTLHHAVADGSTYTHFMKMWSSIHNCGKFGDSVINLPSFDRSTVRDPKLENAFIKDLHKLENDESLEAWDLSGRSNIVRATFVFTSELLAKLGSQTSLNCSPYALACGYIWSCLVRSRGDSSRKKEHFGFVTGCRPRVNPPLPSAYFGNCLGICLVEAKRKDLVASNGAIVAAEEIWKVISGLNSEVFERKESWIRDVFQYASVKALTVAGSPKLGLYNVDFGWGRPRKVEIVSIERTGALSLVESREEKGGIEVGLALPKYDMNQFVTVFVNCLSDLSYS